MDKAKQLANQHWGWLSDLLDAIGLQEFNKKTLGYIYRTAFVHGWKHAQDEIKEQLFEDCAEYMQSKKDEAMKALEDIEAIVKEDKNEKEREIYETSESDRDIIVEYYKNKKV